MVLYAGRVLLGYCTGVLSYVVNIYSSQYVPKIFILMFLNLLFKQWKHVPASNILKKVLFINTTLYALTTPGVIITQVPVFISEIAPKGIRGGLATSNQVREIGAEVPLIIFV